ncbi:DUF1189 domain-containing protein [Bacillus spongiae]|uniref:DUF1189 domain-containing protein n=1 Tax=Bacillus spongiae TaxID=2683610 RepID=A0ABU8HAM8_9BACI
MKENKKSFIQKVRYSVSSPNQFQNMATEGVGRAVLYLLLLTFTIGLFFAIIQSYKFTNLIDGFIDEIESELPDFTLNNGELNVEGDQQVIIEDEGTIIIIDDAENIDIDLMRAEIQTYDSALFILKDRIINKSNFVIDEFKYKDFGNFSLDKQSILDFLPLIKWLSLLIGFIIITWFFVSKLILGLLYALIGLIIAAILNKKLSYGILYAIGIYAITAPTILDVFASLFGGYLPWYAFFIITMVYMGIAINKWGTIDQDTVTK